MHTRPQKTDIRTLAARIWGTMAFLVLVVVAASYFIFQSELQNYIEKEQSKSEKNLSLIEQSLKEEVELVTQDLEFFSRNPAYADYLDQTEIQNDFVVRKTLQAYGEIRGTYHAVKLIDLRGKEQFSLDFTGLSKGKDSLYTLPPSQMQALEQLRARDIFISPIQLYKQGEEVLIPPRPSATFVTPIFRKGKKLGYLFLFFDFTKVLSKLKNLEDKTDTRFLMTDRDGQWLKGPDVYDNFSHILTPGQAKNAQQVYPEIWQKEESLNEAYLNANKGLLGFKHIALSSYILNINRRTFEDKGYYLIALVPKKALVKEARSLLLLLLVYAGLVLLIVLPAFTLLFIRIRKSQSLLARQSKSLAEQNLELSQSKQKLEDSLKAIEGATKEREGYLKKLEKSEQDLQLAQKIAQLTYYSRDIAHEVTEWSKNMAEVFKLDEKNVSVQGPRLKKLIHPEDYLKYQRKWNEAIRERKAFSMVYRIYSQSGGVEYLQDTAQPVVINNRTRYMQGTIQNITERYKNEQALREAKEKAESAAQAKSDFLATMSHEIRTPLNAVLGMANLLKITPLNDRQRDFVQTIEASGDTLLSVINDILDFSKIESGRMSFEEEWFEVNQLLEESLQVVAIGAESKKLRVFYELDRDLPEQIKGDEARIRQCLINFLNNAVKFTQKGHILIKASVVKEATNRVTLRFTVQDTGIGIPEKKQQDVFNAFEQADNSTSRIYGGTGLGLSITKRMVTAMGGEIGVESKEGKGSSFFIELDFASKPPSRPPLSIKPLSLIAEQGEEAKALRSLLVTANIPHQFISFQGKQALAVLPEHTIVLLLSTSASRHEMANLATALAKDHEVHLISNVHRKSPALAKVNIINRPVKLSRLRSITYPLPKAEKENMPLAHTSKDLKILVAEDNPVNQKLILLIFQQLGYQVDMAKNGLEAISKCEEKTYDLVFMDIQMPEMDGIEATAYIRNSRKIKVQPIIIALTANAMQGQKEVYLKAGMDDYIAKPVDFDELTALIEKHGKTE